MVFRLNYSLHACPDHYFILPCLWNSLGRQERMCNTPGVYHQLSNRFELKHDMSSGNQGVKIKSTWWSSNLNLGHAQLLTYGPLLRLCKSNAKHASSMYITSTCIHLDPWKSFMKFGIKKSHEMISHIFAWIALSSGWKPMKSTKPWYLAQTTLLALMNKCYEGFMLSRWPENAPMDQKG